MHVEEPLEKTVNPTDKRKERIRNGEECPLLENARFNTLLRSLQEPKQVILEDGEDQLEWTDTGVKVPFTQYTLAVPQQCASAGLLAADKRPDFITASGPTGI